MKKNELMTRYKKMEGHKCMHFKNSNHLYFHQTIYHLHVMGHISKTSTAFTSTKRITTYILSEYCFSIHRYSTPSLVGNTITKHFDTNSKIALKNRLKQAFFIFHENFYVISFVE